MVVAHASARGYAPHFGHGDTHSSILQPRAHATPPAPASKAPHRFFCTEAPPPFIRPHMLPPPLRTDATARAGWGEPK
eukprot:1889629-Rhodomonas_salina.1